MLDNLCFLPTSCFWLINNSVVHVFVKWKTDLCCVLISWTCCLLNLLLTKICVWAFACQDDKSLLINVHFTSKFQVKLTISVYLNLPKMICCRRSITLSFCSSARTTASVLKRWSPSRLISCRSRNLAVQLSCMLSKYFRMINFNGSNVSDTFSPQFIAAAHLVSDCSCHTVSAFSTMKSDHRTVESLSFSSL